jgi:predicted Fe-Mo cluster-binding NifX family protein
MVIAIPNFGYRVSPRLDYAESLQLITIEDKSIIKKETIKLIVHSNLERINFIINLRPDLIICDGISELSYEKIIEGKTKIIAWVNGTIDDILERYLKGELKDSKNKKINV